MSRSLNQSKILNADCGDLSDMIFVGSTARTYSYYCNSQKCTNSPNEQAKRILKFEAVKLRFDSDCPDCGCVMFCKKAPYRKPANDEVQHETF